MVFRPGFKIASFLFVAVVFLTGCGEDDGPIVGVGGGGSGDIGGGGGGASEGGGSGGGVAEPPGSGGQGSGPSVTPEQNDPPQSSSNDTSAIAGIWDDSGPGDVYYLLINDSGSFADLDYQGDQVGSGLNCYDIYEGSIQNLGNNRYEFLYDGGTPVVVTAFVSNGLLSVQSESGDNFSLSPVSGIDPNIPSCN